MFESIRLCGPITGPARIISSKHPVALATLRSYYTHRQCWAYGSDAASFNAQRFATADPDIGSTKFITGPEGSTYMSWRWFTQEAICVIVKALLLEYEFASEGVVADEEKYIYHAGVMMRKGCRLS
jgi:hypothetical protein